MNGDVKPFRELRATEINPRILKERMDVQGYVLIRNLLFPNDFHRLLTEITQVVAAAKLLPPNRDPLDRIASPGVSFSETDPLFKRISEQVFNLESFHAFQHHPALRQVMEFLVGPHLLVHPKPIPRLVFPNASSFRYLPHQDHHAVAGDLRTYTAWTPLHECLPKLGPLQVLEGSHRFGVQKTPAGSGVIPIEATRGGDWVGGRFSAGDVLILHSLTVHAASPNTSNQLRMAVDCRFQSYDRPINPANLVFTGPNAKSWETTYSHWRSDQLKYYWKRLPLEFKPSLAEVTRLAQEAASPDIRARYASILSQLQEQTPA